MAVPRMLEGAKATRVAALPLQAVAVGTTRWAFITATMLPSLVEVVTMRVKFRLLMGPMENGGLYHPKDEMKRKDLKEEAVNNQWATLCGLNHQEKI